MSFTPSPSALFQAKQSFPGCHTGTIGPITSVTPCRNLSAPAIRRPSPGDDFIQVTQKFPGSVISIFATPNAGTLPSGPPIGRGNGDRLALSRPLAELEHLFVFQTVGNCTSEQAYTIQVDCGADRLGELTYLQLGTHRARRTGGATLTVPACE